MTKFKSAFCALMLTFGLIAGTPAEARGGFLQCAPFARQISGIQLFGRAANWWHEAVGHYARGSLPQIGAVLSFASSHSMPAGHVAVVSKIVSAREVLLTHANWSYRGGVEHDARAVDVSPSGDWSQVKVWYGPIGDLGQRPNAANGFIYASAASDNVDATPVGTTLASR
ncbi:MAG TPA: CHAP domain-containing protein [Sphingobium sp.]|uniref:CHAP domain-containing protein n=1 Tax=Sphingobium sp. TaxID=1912891 RepID=UPI002ED05904